MNTQSGPQRIGKILHEFFQTTGLAARLKHLELYAAWEELVGPELRAHTRVIGFRNHKVHIEVDSAAHLHELSSFCAQSLLEELRARLPALHIAALVFKPGTTRRADA